MRLPDGTRAEVTFMRSSRRTELRVAGSNPPPTAPAQCQPERAHSNQEHGGRFRDAAHSPRRKSVVQAADELSAEVEVEAIRLVREPRGLRRRPVGGLNSGERALRPATISARTTAQRMDVGVQRHQLVVGSKSPSWAVKDHAFRILLRPRPREQSMIRVRLPFQAASRVQNDAVGHCDERCARRAGDERCRAQERKQKFLEESKGASLRQFYYCDTDFTGELLRLRGMR